MAPSGESALDRSKPVLPPSHLGVGLPAMLDEVQLTVRAQDPIHLPKRTLDVGDGTHRPGDQDVVDAVGVQGKQLPVQADVLHRYSTGGDPLGGELAPDRRRIDGLDAANSRRVERDVQARTEADFEDLAGKASRNPATYLGELLPPENAINEAGKDLIGVEAHPGSLSDPSDTRTRCGTPAGWMTWRLSANIARVRVLRRGRFEHATQNARTIRGRNRGTLDQGDPNQTEGDRSRSVRAYGYGTSDCSKWLPSVS